MIGKEGMTRRERVMNSLNFKPVDRIAKDLGGMGSSGISCFAYRRLIDYLKLPERPIRVWDTSQMLALPDLDVLDLLDCDVVHTDGAVTNAFPQPELWHDFDFGGRLRGGQVLSPAAFTVYGNGDIEQLERGRHTVMPRSAVVFNEVAAGPAFDIGDDLPMADLDAYARELEAFSISEGKVDAIAAHMKRVRESTDRAILYDGLNAGMGLPGGLVQGSLLCMLEPEYVKDLHTLHIGFAKRRHEKILPAIAPYVDIVLTAADDMGTQNALVLPPDLCKELHFNLYRELNDLVHRLAPGVKTFLHSCGAIYDILDLIAESGFDILNPVQWSAGGHSYREWKDRVRGKMALWGGAVNAQETLALKTPADIREEAIAVSRCFLQGSGVVFNSCHNLLAEISPEKIMALYGAAQEV